MGGASDILVIKNVTKKFGGIIASNKININVKKGDIHGVIGPNGAGKTTLFNMITGVYNTSEGEIFFDNEKINGKKSHEISTMGIARTFQNIRLFGDLSVFENLHTACQKNITYSLIDGLLRTKKYREQEKKESEKCIEALASVGLEAIREQKANNLPYGMQRRLEIARALVMEPKLILLDEPAAGMNEEESAQLSEFILEIRKKYDISIIIIDHHMDVIMNICDRMSVLNFGNLLAEGSPEEIQNNPQVIEAYLGVDEAC